jgi:hypothetical protein
MTDDINKTIHKAAHGYKDGIEAWNELNSSDDCLGFVTIAYDAYQGHMMEYLRSYGIVGRSNTWGALLVFSDHITFVADICPQLLELVIEKGVKVYTPSGFVADGVLEAEFGYSTLKVEIDEDGDTMHSYDSEVHNPVVDTEAGAWIEGDKVVTV